MLYKLKKTAITLLCLLFLMCSLCACNDDKTKDENSSESGNASENVSDEKECSKEEYVARITSYKEYYESVEKDYYSVNGAILVHEDGKPYMVLCCILEQDVDNYKIQLIDYNDGKTVLNGEKEFYGGDRNCDIDIAFLDDRCIMKFDIIEGDSEYWEFKQNNLVAQKLNEDEVTKFVEDISRYGYVYDISEKPYEYLYTYEKGKLIGHNHDTYYGTTKIFDKKVSIYDEESNITTVNKIAAQKLYDYMQLSDEQKEYFVYPKTNENGEEILIADVANIYSCEVLMPLSYHRWMKGVSFKQCLNELISEPIYRIEDLMIKELNFDWYNKYSEDMSQIAVDRKAEELKVIEERMPKYNPYSSDEELLKMYYSYVNNTLNNWNAFENCYKCKDTDLATIMTMDNDFAKVFKTYFEEDYVFTSDKFKGATWKDIVYNGGSSYPTLTVSKNGNALTVPIIDDPIMKEAVEAYLAYGCANWFAIEFAYVDEDEIPELISESMDGGWNIYTYKNGAVIELIRDEAIGWGPIKEYEPKQNKITVDQWYDGGLIEVCIQGNKIVPIKNTDNNKNNSAGTEIDKALEAYATKATGESYGIALAYVDEDDVPEMIVDRCDDESLRYMYSIIYSYKNGKISEYSNGYTITKYIPKANMFIENEQYQVFEEGDDGNWYIDTREVVSSMKGTVSEDVPMNMFVNIKYYDDFETALANFK